MPNSGTRLLPWVFDGETFYTEPKVDFICQRVDFTILERWTQYVDTNRQKERDKINAVIEKAPRSEG